MSKPLIILLLVLASLYTHAQNHVNVIQFTGMVFTSDSSSVIPGVHIYAPSAGRGTTTNPYGFFSLPVLEGDSLVFSAVGFKKQSFVVPKHDSDQSLKRLLTLEEDIAFLEEVEIFPYPSEAMFKKAVLAMGDESNRAYENMEAWLTAQYMSKAYQSLPNSANANHAYFLQQQAMANGYKTQVVPTTNYVNPFAWARFIKAMKKK